MSWEKDIEERVEKVDDKATVIHSPTGNKEQDQEDFKRIMYYLVLKILENNGMEEKAKKLREDLIADGIIPPEGE